MLNRYFEPFKSLKKRLVNTRTNLIFYVCFGAVSLTVALLVALSTYHASQKDTKSPTFISTVTGARKADISANNFGKANQPSNDPGSATTKTTTPTSGGATTNSQKSSANKSMTPQTPSPKADYNLNDNWYFTTVGIAGLYNTCWPTALTAANEAQCGDPNSVYSKMMFVGIGISKDPTAVATLAENDANAKAAAQHVDPRRGGGDNVVILTEAICTQYGLSCGRW